MPGIQDTIDKLKEITELQKAAYEAKVSEISQTLTATGEEIQNKVNEKLAEFDTKLAEQQEKILSVSRNTSLPGSEDDKKKFSLHGAYKYIFTGEERDCGFEKEIFDNMRQRAATANDGTAGAYLIPTELADEIVEPAIAAMPVYGLGIETMTGLVGNVSIPVLESRQDASVTHVAESGTPTELSYVFGEKNLSPKRCAAYTKVSQQLIMQTRGTAESFIRRQLQTDMTLKIHNTLINGSGSDKEPKGILNYTGFTSTEALGTNGGQFIVKKAKQMKTDLEEVDFDLSLGKFGFLMRPIVMEGMAMQRIAMYSGQTSQKGFVFSPPIIGKDALETQIGARIATTTHVPNNLVKGTTTDCSAVLYGDWTKFVLALWAGLALSTSTEASSGSDSAWLQNQVWIKADQYYDLAVTNPAAFTKIEDAFTNRSQFTEY
jgi:HK97 family phage major capsid protein